MTFITEANAIFNQIRKRNINLNIEAYSCKYTRKQKKRQIFKSTFNHLVNTLELASLKNKVKIRSEDFKLKYFSDIKNDVFLVLMRCKVPDAERIIRMLTICLQNSIGLNDTSIYSLENRFALISNSNSYLCYLFYNRKMKRIVLLTLFYNLNMN